MPSETAASPASAPRRKPACPICGRPAEDSRKPFCSRRCADIDLGRWLGEAYRIPDDEPGKDIPDSGRPEEGA